MSINSVKHHFKKSSLCETQGTCVEVALLDRMVAIRDPKNLEQAPLYFNQEEWRVFIAGVKKGEFDC